MFPKKSYAEPSGQHQRGYVDVKINQVTRQGVAALGCKKASGCCNTFDSAAESRKRRWRSDRRRLAGRLCNDCHQPQSLKKPGFSTGDRVSQSWGESTNPSWSGITALLQLACSAADKNSRAYCSDIAGKPLCLVNSICSVNCLHTCMMYRKTKRYGYNS